VEEKAKQETSMQVTDTALLERNHQETSSRALLFACFIRVSCFAYSSTLKMGAVSSPEAFVGFQLATQRFISEENYS
jgi:hypothetical protein